MALKSNKPKSTVNAAGNYTKPTLIKLRQVAKVEHLDNGRQEKPKWSHKNIKKQVVGTEVDIQA